MSEKSQKISTLKFVGILLAVLPTLFFSGCGDTEQPKEENKTTTTQPQPPQPPSVSITLNEAKAFMDDYLIVGNQKDIPGILQFYDLLVDYFGKGMVGHDFISKDKKYYFRRWPQVSYHLNGDIVMRDTDDHAVKTLIVPISFHVHSPARKESISGTARNTFKIRRIRGHIKIVDEKQKVVSRKKSRE